jgi:SAM-dependent methyltransferase
MDAEHLAFPDNSFDTVMASFVFCSVADPVQGFREVRRVCRAGGQVLLLEHVRSRPPFGWLMDIANPVAVRMGGENINRQTVENMRRAGLEPVQVDNLFLDVFKLIEARPKDQSEIDHHPGKT